MKEKCATSFLHGTKKGKVISREDTVETKQACHATRKHLLLRISEESSLSADTNIS